VPFPSSWPLRIAYVGTLLGALLPLKRDLMGGGSGISIGNWRYVLLVPSLALAAICVWRLVMVLTDKNALDSLAVEGPLLAARRLGMLFMYLATGIFLLTILGGPLIWLSFSDKSVTGAVGLVLGFFLTLLAGIGPIGLIAFEFSRLRAFELMSKERDS